MLKKKMPVISLSMLALLVVGGYTGAGLVTMLGIDAAAANKVIDIIDAASAVATVVSLIAVIVGAGVVSTALLATAKKLIVKYGKKYAAAW